MNEKIAFGQYYNANSIIHKLDPRIKLLGLIVFMSLAFLIPFNNFVLLGILALVIIIIICLSTVPIIKYLKSLKQIAILLIFSFIFQLLTNKNGALITEFDLYFSIFSIDVVFLIFFLFIVLRKYIPSKMLVFLLLLGLSIYIFTFTFNMNILWNPTIRIYKGGLISGLFIISRVFLIILLSTTLTLTTKPLDLSAAIEWYLKPLELIKLKPSILAMMISIALRFIPTLFNETDKILKAQASRGVDFKEGKLHTQVRQIISLLIPMFVIAFKRALDLADAMEARGYIPGEKRTRLYQLRFHIKDYVALVILTCLLAALITLKVCHAI